MVTTPGIPALTSLGEAHQRVHDTALHHRAEGPSRYPSCAIDHAEDGSANGQDSRSARSPFVLSDSEVVSSSIGSIEQQFCVRHQRGKIIDERTPIATQSGAVPHYSFGIIAYNPFIHELLLFRS